jgi:hypothetical protein
VLALGAPPGWSRSADPASMLDPSRTMRFARRPLRRQAFRHASSRNGGPLLGSRCVISSIGIPACPPTNPRWRPCLQAPSSSFPALHDRPGRDDDASSFGSARPPAYGIDHLWRVALIGRLAWRDCAQIAVPFPAQRLPGPSVSGPFWGLTAGMSTVRPEQKYFLTGALIVAVLLLLAAAEHMGWW